jgi:pimeloyl-ACP methyl ester carboxylesterase
MVTRRAALLAGLGLAVAGCSSGLPGGVPDVGTGRFITGSFRSRYRHTDVGWAVSYPPRHTGRLPVLVFLHGRSGDHNGPFSDSLHLDHYLASAAGHGVRPFAIAAVDGGDHEYWHPRRGTDPAGMVIHEFLPLLGRHGLDVRRFGLMGNSMGGYGTLYLAERLGRARVAVAVAESPAIWHEAAETVEGAFDDPTDFAAHTIFGRRRLQRLDGIALRIDCGDQDGFAPITRELRARIRPRPAGGIEPGGHDSDYWRRQAPAQLRFVGRHLQ